MSEHSGFKLKSAIDFNKVTSPIPVIFVAASNASAQAKRVANYVCDGVDDQTEINTAITLLNSLNGGRLVLSEGNFTITNTISLGGIVKGIIIEGQGNGTVLLCGSMAGNSVFDLTNAQNNTIRNLKLDSQSAINFYGIYLSNNSQYNIIENVTLNWLNSNKSTIALFGYYAPYVLQYNIIRNNKIIGSGIQFYDEDYQRNKYNIIQDNIIEDITGTDGMYLYGGDSNIITGNIIKNAKRYGISGAGGLRNQIINNIIINSGSRGINFENVQEADIVSNNQISLSGQNGIYISGGAGYVITGNILKDNCQTANDTYSELYIEGNKLIISDNNILCTLTNKAKYGIELFNGDNSIILGNVVRGAVTTQIILSGTIVGIIKEHNIELA